MRDYATPIAKNEQRQRAFPARAGGIVIAVAAAILLLVLWKVTGTGATASDAAKSEAVERPEGQGRITIPLKLRLADPG